MSKSKEDKVKEYLEKYNALSKEYGLGLTAFPRYAQREDGSFTTQVVLDVKPLHPDELKPKEAKN